MIVCEDSDVFAIRFTGGHFQYCWYGSLISLWKDQYLWGWIWQGESFALFGMSEFALDITHPLCR